MATAGPRGQWARSGADSVTCGFLGASGCRWAGWGACGGGRAGRQTWEGRLQVWPCPRASRWLHAVDLNLVTVVRGHEHEHPQPAVSEDTGDMLEQDRQPWWADGQYQLPVPQGTHHGPPRPQTCVATVWPAEPASPPRPMGQAPVSGSPQGGDVAWGARLLGQTLRRPPTCMPPDVGALLPSATAALTRSPTRSASGPRHWSLPELTRPVPAAARGAARRLVSGHQAQHPPGARTAVTSSPWAAATSLIVEMALRGQEGGCFPRKLKMPGPTEGGAIKGRAASSPTPAGQTGDGTAAGTVPRPCSSRGRSQQDSAHRACPHVSPFL